MRRSMLGAVVLLCAAAILVGACGDDDQAATDPVDEERVDEGEQDGPAASEDGDTDQGETSTTLPAGDDDEQPEPGTVIEVRVSGGDVQGGGRKVVDLGETVVLRVTSDVADHVHVHGYDLLSDVAAGETVEITFDATIPGVFEVELEDARIPLLELQIS